MYHLLMKKGATEPLTTNEHSCKYNFYAIIQGHYVIEGPFDLNLSSIVKEAPLNNINSIEGCLSPTCALSWARHSYRDYCRKCSKRKTKKLKIPRR